MIKYKIIVQAGGKGTRLEKYTKNKPKALLPVDNLPMIFHLFRKFSGSEFIIISDYKFDVFKRYLEKFCNEKFTIVKANSTGTCAGMNEALSYIQSDEPFLIIWSDLIIEEKPTFTLDDFPFVGLSKELPCRWSFTEEFIEDTILGRGVAGYFGFRSKESLLNLPDSGEFVRFLSNSKIYFNQIEISGIKEFGLISTYEKYENRSMRVRPFNSISVSDDRIVKTPITDKGIEIAKSEIAWYKTLSKTNIDLIPIIYSYSPLEMERIEGLNLDLLSENKKELAFNKALEAIRNLHLQYDEVEVDKLSCDKEYYYKTISRLDEVRSIIPFANNEFIYINGKRIRNVLYYLEEFEGITKSIYPEKFSFIHGDPTFSNMLFTNDDEIKFIDPRGYFGNKEFFGDSDYDFAKFYYSFFGNYDSFNKKRFHLSINENSVDFDIISNGYEKFEKVFFDVIGFDKERKIKIIHALIWLSLTTYAWEDYDSICGAFYNGCLLLEEYL